ncbi:hypothetical protein [Brevibacillus laterosporus]|uniref:hypothetical protein n=1 Tax=Brevibacillus laterosporus TaxID=1465 RepID=UPI000EABF2D2|nr:hypothetical protein [Brevibacillus laterosporus]AYK06312.1 hypothetical protein D8Z77_07850 [Brevibacillus laterosporus]
MLQPVVQQEEVEVEDILSTNIDKFKEWLEKLGITHIVSYDDEWGKVEEGTYAESINKYLDMELEEFIDKFVIKIDEKEEEALEEDEIETVEDILKVNSPSDLISLKEKIQNVFSVNKIIKPLEVLKLMMEQISVDVKIDFQMNTKPDYEEIAKIDGRILFLIDMNMENVGLGEDSVIDVITLLKKNRSNNFDLAIVYSHEDLSRYKQHSSKVTYIEDYLEKHSGTMADYSGVTKSQFKYLFAYQLWGINKTIDETELAKELLTTIEQAAFGYSLHDYLESKVLLAQEATTELVNLSEEKFDLLLQDSFIEGERFLDILNRTHQSIFRRMEFDKIKNDDKYKEVMKNVMSVASAKDKSLLEKIKEQKIINFSRKEILGRIGKKSYSDIAEFNLVNYGVNELFENIATGDLFEIMLHEEQAVQYAVLISASCDLPLRFPEKIQDKIDRKKESVVLCFYNCDEIGEMEDKDLKKIIGNEQSLWPIMLEDGKSYVLTPTQKMLTVNGKLLDLCAFNSTGEAKIDKQLISMSRPYKNYHSLKYMAETLIPWIDDVKNLKSYLGDSIENNQIQESDLLPILAGLKYNVKMNYERSKFEIKRIGRLEKELALNVVQYNTSNLSRIGLEKIPLR